MNPTLSCVVIPEANVYNYQVPSNGDCHLSAVNKQKEMTTIVKIGPESIDFPYEVGADSKLMICCPIRESFLKQNVSINDN